MPKRVYKKRKTNSYRGYGAYKKRVTTRKRNYRKRGTGNFNNNPWTIHGYGGYWEDFKYHVKNIWNGVKQAAHKAWPYIKKYGPWVATAILAYFAPDVAAYLGTTLAQYGDLAQIVKKIADTPALAAILPQWVITPLKHVIEWAFKNPENGLEMAEEIQESMQQENKFFQEIPEVENMTMNIEPNRSSYKGGLGGMKRRDRSELNNPGDTYGPLMKKMRL